MGLFALAETVEFPCGKVLGMSAYGPFASIWEADRDYRY
jgi:hypothetical protein